MQKQILCCIFHMEKNEVRVGHGSTKSFQAISSPWTYTSNVVYTLFLPLSLSLSLPYGKTFIHGKRKDGENKVMRHFNLIYPKFCKALLPGVWDPAFSLSTAWHIPCKSYSKSAFLEPEIAVAQRCRDELLPHCNTNL